MDSILFQSILIVLITQQVIAYYGCSMESYNISNYPQSQVCESIDLVKTNLTTEYNHCRVVRGYVSIRYLYPKPNTSFISFPNLEVITDFLLIHHLHASEEGNFTLDEIFPKLTAIYGTHRFMNNTFYVSNYAGKSLQLSSLTKLCGPLTIQYSDDLCFRHSATYWQLLTHRNFEARFDLIPDLTLKHMAIQSIESDGFIASFRNKLKHPVTEIDIWKVKNVRYSIFKIDRSMYDWIQENKTGFEKPKCTEPIKPLETFTIDNLIDSDKINKYVSNHAKEHIHSGEKLAKLLSVSEQLIMEPPEQKLKDEWTFLLDNYDIKSITHLFSEYSTRREYALTEPFEYKYGYVYIIKVYVCSGNNINSCNISQFFKFIPTQELLIPSSTEKPSIPPSSTSSTSTTSPTSSTSSNAFNIIPLTNILTIIAIIFVCSIILYIIRKPFLKRVYVGRLKRFKASVVSVNPEYTPIGSTCSWEPTNEQSSENEKSFETNRSKLTILSQRILGKGEFGIVCEGILFDHGGFFTNDSTGGGGVGGGGRNGNNSVRVAVKQLHNSSKQIDKQRFMLEARFMSTFDSNFLVKLIGVCTLQEPILVIMEYMENGDLKNYLQKKLQQYRLRQDMGSMPSYEDTVRMAIQIADGMYYLHSKKVIHRDLAARNCMVSHDLTVKIGDFGLTRNTYEKDYYRITDQALLPIRWMSPEVVRTMVFTTHSDVWSYGVVLWEIMTYGEQPYVGKTEMEVKHLLSNYVRLKRPIYYNHLTWEIAKKCWDKNPKNRPNFPSIIDTLLSHIGNNGTQFMNMSFYHQMKAQYQPETPNPLTTIVSNNCVNFLSKFCYHKCVRSTEQQTKDCTVPKRTACNSCANSSNEKKMEQSSEPKQISLSNINRIPFRSRCQSVDSMQSNSDCSEITAMTYISNSYDPNVRYVWCSKSNHN